MGAKSVEVKEVEKPVNAASDEVVSEKAEGSPAAAEESTEVTPVATEESREVNPAVGESTQGGARNFCLGGPICVANLLIYTNFYTHTQTHASIHIHKKLVSFIINP